MSKVINCNISGDPVGDIPTLVVDDGFTVNGVIQMGTRCVFSLPNETVPWGFSIYWQSGKKTARGVVPELPGEYEGGLMDVPIPTLAYSNTAASAIRVEGDKFLLGDKVWLWKGATDFRLLQLYASGQEINNILDQRQNAGANLLRVLAMKANNTGWEFVPGQTPNYWEHVRRFLEHLKTRGLFCEFTAFADTRILMPHQDQQQAFWNGTINTLRGVTNVVVELVNEAGHATQSINPANFERPSGLICSHGSGGTDEPPVSPLWDYATYHARREPDGRGFTNYDPYEFQRDFPKSGPLIPDEGIKPENYSYSTDYAHRIGQHAACGAGGTFHTGAGVNSIGWNQPEMECAVAFFAGVQ